MEGLVDFMAIASPARRTQIEDALYALRGEYESPAVFEDDAVYDDIDEWAQEILDYDDKLRRRYRKKQITLACCLKHTALPIEMQLHILSYTEAPLRPADWLESKHSPLDTALGVLESDYGGPRENNLDLIANSIMYAFPWFQVPNIRGRRIAQLFLTLLRPQKKTTAFFRSLVFRVHYSKQADALLELALWMLEHYTQDCIEDTHELDLCLLDLFDWGRFDGVRKPLVQKIATLGSTDLCKLIHDQ
jgi:hypothetical protein